MKHVRTVGIAGRANFVTVTQRLQANGTFACTESSRTTTISGRKAQFLATVVVVVVVITVVVVDVTVRDGPGAGCR